MTSIINIAGYKFIILDNLVALKTEFSAFCRENDLTGTVLLSVEGINLNLSGEVAKIISFKKHLLAKTAFSDMTFRESYSQTVSFKRLKIKIKPEIITFKNKAIRAHEASAPRLSPAELKQWLDENKEMTLLDTRNDFEVRFGTFKQAINLKIADFTEFNKAATSLKKDKPIVMFCTGGIRCEKASLHLLNLGHKEVYQLDGGILNYFKEIGEEYYQGDCFVFDERIALDAKLQSTKTKQCTRCFGPLTTVCTTCLS